MPCSIYLRVYWNKPLRAGQSLGVLRGIWLHEMACSAASLDSSLCQARLKHNALILSHFYKGMGTISDSDVKAETYHMLVRRQKALFPSLFCGVSPHYPAFSPRTLWDADRCYAKPKAIRDLLRAPLGKKYE
jgi:hypothetical protein